MSDSPLRAVLAAFTAGARSRSELVRATGLLPDVVDLAVDRLVRLGRLQSRPLSGSSCPTDGCGSCGSADDADAGCAGGSAGARPAGPVLLELRRAAPDRGTGSSQVRTGDPS